MARSVVVALATAVALALATVIATTCTPAATVCQSDAECPLGTHCLTRTGACSVVAGGDEGEGAAEGEGVVAEGEGVAAEGEGAVAEGEGVGGEGEGEGGPATGEASIAVLFGATAPTRFVAAPAPIVSVSLEGTAPPTACAFAVPTGGGGDAIVEATCPSDVLGDSDAQIVVVTTAATIHVHIRVRVVPSDWHDLRFSRRFHVEPDVTRIIPASNENDDEPWYVTAAVLPPGALSADIEVLDDVPIALAPTAAPFEVDGGGIWTRGVNHADGLWIYFEHNDVDVLASATVTAPLWVNESLALHFGATGVDGDRPLDENSVDHAALSLHDSAGASVVGGAGVAGGGALLEDDPLSATIDPRDVSLEQGAIAVWVKLELGAEPTSFPVAIRATSSTGTVGNAAVELDAFDTGAGVIGCGDVDSTVSCVSNKTIFDDDFHLLGMAWTHGAVAMSVDGVATGLSTQRPGAFTALQAADIIVGARVLEACDATDNTCVNGIVDELRVWPTTRTDAGFAWELNVVTNRVELDHRFAEGVQFGEFVVDTLATSAGTFLVDVPSDGHDGEPCVVVGFLAAPVTEPAPAFASGLGIGDVDGEWPISFTSANASQQLVGAFQAGVCDFQQPVRVVTNSSLPVQVALAVYAGRPEQLHADAGFLAAETAEGTALSLGTFNQVGGGELVAAVATFGAAPTFDVQHGGERSATATDGDARLTLVRRPVEQTLDSFDVGLDPASSVNGMLFVVGR